MKIDVINHSGTVEVYFYKDDLLKLMGFDVVEKEEKLFVKHTTDLHDTRKGSLQKEWFEPIEDVIISSSDFVKFIRERYEINKK